MVNIVVPKSAVKSAAMLAAAMLSLGVMGQSDLALNGSDSKVEQVTTQMTNDIFSTFKYSSRKRKNDKIPMTDEEKMHKLAIAFSLIGFCMPFFFNIFSNSSSNERKHFDESV